MAQRSREPSRLKRGKEFHEQVQRDWRANAEGVICTERGVTKPSGRGGRVDVFVEEADGLVAVAEIKDSDWDAMTERALRRNVRRQVAQVWSYIESQLADDIDVSPGIIFRKRPTTAGRLELIEALFEEEGIPVVWEDESIQERKQRA